MSMGRARLALLAQLAGGKAGPYQLYRESDRLVVTHDDKAREKQALEVRVACPEMLRGIWLVLALAQDRQ